jgi:antitoxin component YwqK of YwqJK toxin-antitoxin module
MAQQVRYRNSWWFFMFILVLQGCNSGMQHQYPAVYVNAVNTQLHQHEGTLYKNNKRFSGHVFELFANGDTASTSSYLDGKQHGVTKRWYENRRPAEIRYYDHGGKEGRHIGWWENGRRKFEYNFLEDEHHGELKEWFSTGVVSRIFHHNKGHEEGSQKMWWDNGDIRANYFVKAGERFGLIGQKMCKNNLDSLP